MSIKSNTRGGNNAGRGDNPHTGKKQPSYMFDRGVPLGPPQPMPDWWVEESKAKKKN